MADNEFAIRPRQKSDDMASRLDRVLQRAEEQPGSASLYREIANFHADAVAGREGFDDPEKARAFWSRENEIADARARVGDAVCNSPKALSDLARQDPALIDAVMADRAAAQPADVDVERLAHLNGQTRFADGVKVNAPNAAMSEPEAFGDPVKGFAAADAQYRSLIAHPVQFDGPGEGSRQLTDPNDIAQLRAYRKAAAEQIAANPLQAVQLGVEHPEHVTTVAGLAGNQPSQADRARAQGPRFRDGMRVEPLSDTQVVSDYAGADGRASMAARQGDWETYAQASQERKQLAREMAARPTALALAGQELSQDPADRKTPLTNGAGARLRGDLEEIQSSKQDKSAREESYEDFRQRFMENAGNKDAVSLYASVSEAQVQAQKYEGPVPLPGLSGDKKASGLQIEMPEGGFARQSDPVAEARQGGGSVFGGAKAGASTGIAAALGASSKAPDFANQQHLERLSQELSGEIFQSPKDVQKLHSQHPHLSGKAAQEAESMRQHRAPEAEAAVVDQAEKTPVADGAGDVSREQKAANDVAQKRGDAENTPQHQSLQEKWESARVANVRDLKRHFYETEQDESGRERIVREENGRPKMRNLSDTKAGLALPINAFGGGAGQIQRALASEFPGHKQKSAMKNGTEFGVLSGQEVRTLYYNTVSARNEISERAKKNPVARHQAHDELEMGRRALASEMVARGLAEPDEIAKDAHRFQGKEARKFAERTPHLARDPGSAIREGDLNKRKEVLRKGRSALKEKTKQGVREGAARTGQHAGNFLDKGFDEVIS